MLIGREKEQTTLKKALESDVSELIAVYGRRRVGKTFLIRETFGYHFTFQHAGLHLANKSAQLKAFADSIKDAGMPVDTPPKNWLEAFELLKDLIRKSDEARKVIFIDELSWMDSKKSDLLIALEHFWNGWASARRDILLIICSSVTSWMVNKIIHNKGGLYHRLTAKIYLQPFTLHECEQFAQAKGLGMRRSQILEMYMVLGGIPHYWNFVQKEYSVPQNIDALFFEGQADMEDEFDHLFSSLFEKPEAYIQIVEALAGSPYGMTRQALLKATGQNGSGHFSIRLNELESCGFIRSYESFGREKKDTMYQLIDAFTIFHYHFLRKKPKDPHFWCNQINTPRVNTWHGLAFERVCLLHIDQIRKALGITGVLTHVCSWTCKQNPDKGIQGSQIDLLLVRNDHVINLIEEKYSDKPFSVTQEVLSSLERKRNDLYIATETRDAVHFTLVTPLGLVQNAYAKDIQSQVTLDALFEP